MARACYFSFALIKQPESPRGLRLPTERVHER